MLIPKVIYKSIVGPDNSYQKEILPCQGYKANEVLVERSAPVLTTTLLQIFSEFMLIPKVIYNLSIEGPDNFCQGDPSQVLVERSAPVLTTCLR